MPASTPITCAAKPKKPLLLLCLGAAPGLRAVDPTHLGGLDIKPDVPDWRTAREREFHEAMEKLRQHGSAALIMNLCIYNERPAFLQPGKRGLKNSKRLRIQLCEGFDILFTHWKK